MPCFKAGWEEDLYRKCVVSYENYEDCFECDCDKLVVFGRVHSIGRWIVIYAGEQPAYESAEGKRRFKSVIRSVNLAESAQYWCIVYGYYQTLERSVITIFSDTWMVYDRYGAYKYTSIGAQTTRTWLCPSGVAAVEGPVPNTNYKSAGDSKALIKLSLIHI